MFNSLFLSNNRQLTALLVGLLIGAGGGLLALLLVLLGPVMAFGFVFGLVAAVYILTDLHGGLYATMGIIALLPFAQVPFQMSPRPTLLDGALGGFLVVYLMQWMSGQRRLFRSTPVTPVVLVFTGFMFFAYLMGLRHAMLDTRTMRTVFEMIMSLLLIPILIDVMRDEQSLRRAAFVLILCGAAQAALGIGLWLLPDMTAEALLNRLGIVGYPVGGVIRYRQTYGSILNERAIGTWIDPNAFGGFLLVVAALAAPQLFAQKPVMRRWLAAGALGTMFLALFLTDSRGSMLSLAAALGFIAVLRYRRLLYVMIAVGVIMLFMPFTQRYIAKLEAGFNNQDVETQMRWGEYKDAVHLIERHPLIGVGFSGVPENDLYLGVANTYLTIASHSGLIGLGLYLLMMGSAFLYSLAHYAQLQAYPAISDVWLGTAAGIVGALGGGVFDHFYFKIDEFQATMALVWILLGLMLASTRLAVVRAENAPPGR